MPYRRSGEMLEVRAAHGQQEIVTTLEGLEIRGPNGPTLVVTRQVATLSSGEQLPIRGRLVVAQNNSDEVGIWIELGSAMRRILGAPREVATPLRSALRRHCADVHSATELGAGRHRMLIVELADCHLVYASRLFREQAELVTTLRRDGRLMVRVDGDQVQFVDGTDMRVTHFAFPWLAPADRAELVRRLSRALGR